MAAGICEEVVFFGGSYRVVTSDPYDTYALRQLARAVWLAEPPLTGPPWQAASEVVRGALSLSDALCDAGDLQRGVPAPFSPGALVRVGNRPVDGLEVLSTTVGAPTHPERLRPFRQRDGTIVSVAPYDIVPALRQTLLDTAAQTGLDEELARRFREAIFDAIVDHCIVLGAEPVQTYLHAPGSDIAEALFRIDTDKALHVASVGDRDTPGELARGLHHLAQRLFFQPAGPNELLQIVVTGAQPVSVPDAPAHLGIERVVLRADELEVIARAEMGQPLALLTWARARRRLRERAVVLGGALAEFAFWRDNDKSFYLGDGPSPNVVRVPRDAEHALREEVQHRYDAHGVPGPRANSTIEVLRAGSNPHEPLYLPVVDIGGDVDGLVVEGLALPVWVMFADRYIQLAEMLAYWVWQLSAVLEPVAEHLATKAEALIIELRIAGTDDEWSSPSTPPGDIGLAEPDAPAMLVLTLTPAAGVAMTGPDNAGERAICELMLDGLAQLAGREHLSLDAIRDGLEQYARLGPKRKITRLNRADDPRIYGGGLPRSRGRSKAHADERLDELAVHRGTRLPWGPLPGGERTAALNEAADFHAAQLGRLVATLGPDLLGRLITDHEALVHEQAVRDLTLANRLACYGDHPAIVERLRGDVPEAAAAAAAARFLIEYVAAQPPAGIRPYSRDVHDCLLALADQVITRGLNSDVIRYGLGEDMVVSNLRSGRLGVRRGGIYDQARDGFLARFAADIVATSSEQYARRWQRGDVEQPAGVGRINDAVRAELGLSLEELAHFLHMTEYVGTELEDEAKHVSLKTFTARIRDELGWSERSVGTAIDLFVLRPRHDFWHAPSQCRKEDVWPWRFNRSLSYIRRPLVVRSGADSDEIWWGVRHVRAAGEHLVDLCLGGRLKAQTKPMRRLLAEIREDEAEGFNDAVAELFEAMPSLVVARRVVKLGGERIRRANGDLLGDIDVLVADPRRKRLWAIDTKDLAPGRAPHELASELASTFAIDPGTKSKAAIHLERLAYLHERRGAALDTLRLPSDDAELWTTTGLFVLSSEMVAPHLAGLPFEVISIRTLRDWIAGGRFG